MGLPVFVSVNMPSFNFGATATLATPLVFSATWQLGEKKYRRTWGEGRNDHIELGPSVCQWIQNN